METTDIGPGRVWEDRKGELSGLCFGSGRHRRGLAGVEAAYEKLQLSNIFERLNG